MELEIIILSEVRERQISYDIIYMQNLRTKCKWTDFQNRKGHTDIESKLKITKGEKWGGINQEFGINTTHYYI